MQKNTTKLVFFFVLSFTRSNVLYSPTFLSHFHKPQSVSSPMVPIICIICTPVVSSTVSSDTLVRLASGLSEQCVKKQCGLALDLRRVREGAAAMRQDRNNQKVDNAMSQKGFNTLVMLSIQHDFCHVQNNWKLGTGKSQTSVSSRKLRILGEKNEL